MKAEDIKLKFKSLQIYKEEDYLYKLLIFSELTKEELDTIVKEYSIEAVIDSFGHKNDCYKGANVIFEFIMTETMLNSAIIKPNIIIVKIYPLIPDDLLGDGYITAEPIMNIPCIVSQYPRALDFYYNHKKDLQVNYIGNLCYSCYQDILL